MHEDPRERRGDRTGPKWAWASRPRPAGPAHSRGRFGPPFLAPEGSSTLKPWRRLHSHRREPFAPGGHPQARERGGRSPEWDRPPRRKHPQVEMEDTVGRVTMINGAMSSTLMGKYSFVTHRTCIKSGFTLDMVVLLTLLACGSCLGSL
jgi:hypothetical protein